MLKRLRLKFVCIMMTIVSLMLVLIFGLVLHFTQRDMEESSVQMMHSVAMMPGRPGRPNDRPAEVQLPFFVLRVQRSGEIVVSNSGSFDLSDEPFLDEITAIALASEAPTGVLREEKLRFCRVTIPDAQLLVFADISSELAMMENLLVRCSLIGLAAFVAFLLLSFLLANWAVKPVDQAWQQQRQFIADASHELKTPLTVIMTNAELLQDPSYPDSTRDQFSASILTMSLQMRGLVERLLDLARVDNGSAHQVFGPVALSQLISDSVLPFEPLCFEQNFQLQCAVEEGLSVRGSEAHLRQLPDILLDNALKYASPQAVIQVQLKKQGTHALFSVANSGPPIPPEERKNIFKRFYRADKARSRTGSYGLGLAIAEGIVKDHRGKIWVESRDGINTFFIQLPLQ